jgi:membrane-associated phospholipid phosphatase
MQAQAPAVRPSTRAGLFSRLGPDLTLLFFFTAIFVAMAFVWGAKPNFNNLTIIMPLIVYGGILIFTAIWHVRRRLRGEPADYWARIREATRDWAPFIGLIIVYEHMYMYTGLIRHDRLDGLMMKWDVAIFGVEPTQWAGRFAHPALTNFFAVMYNMYFPLPLFLCIALVLRRRREDFRELSTAIVIVMFLGFLGYTLVPVGPPRFFLEGHFDPPRLTGWFFEASQDAQDSINRTRIAASFPSQHAALSLLALIYAWRFGKQIGKRWLLVSSFVFISVSLWLSTVYLRHHWVVDLFAGFAVAAVAAVLSPILRRVWSVPGGWAYDHS